MRATNAQSSEAAALTARSPFSKKLNIAGIPNAGKVSDQLYRGAQPRSGSVLRLKELGITTIVDLRGEDVGNREQERKEAEMHGIHFVSIPVSGWSPPTNDQISQFLSLFHRSPEEKVFVHCRFGEDRTGVFVAAYRMTMQKWTSEQAIHEMYFFGFNGFWHPGMIAYVRKFPTLLSSVPALTAFGPSPSAVSHIAGTN